MEFALLTKGDLMTGKPVAIRIVGGSDNYIGRNNISGYETAIELDGGQRNIVHENNIISSETIAMFNGMSTRVNESGLNADDKANLLASISAMQRECGRPSFRSRYQAFMESVVLHAELLAVVSPYLPQLTALLPT